MARDYQPLGRAGLRSAFMAARGWSRLYLGSDHLLLVNFDGFSEDYRRFYLRDIQGFTARRTNRWLWVNVFPALFILLFVIVAFAIDEPQAFLVFGIFSALALIPVVVNLVLGPSCQAYIQTAVQTEELPSLNRVRKFNRILNRLQPLIESAQAGLAPAPAPAAAVPAPAAAPPDAPPESAPPAPSA